MAKLVLDSEWSDKCNDFIMFVVCVVLSVPIVFRTIINNNASILYLEGWFLLANSI
jgi:hypothetical protein